MQGIALSSLKQSEKVCKYHLPQFDNSYPSPQIPRHTGVPFCTQTHKLFTYILHVLSLTNHDKYNKSWSFLVLKSFINPNSKTEKSIGSTTKTSKIEWMWILKSSFHHRVILPDQAICALWYRKGKKLPQQLLSGGPLFKAVKKATHSPQKYNTEFLDNWNSASSTTKQFFSCSLHSKQPCPDTALTPGGNI